MSKKRKSPKEPTCPYCGKKAVCQNSSKIYTKSHGWLWICPDYPACDSYVGCHKGTNVALGTMANANLRELRKRAHRAFDYLWKSGNRTRTQAYRWLSSEIGVPIYLCHIAMFDEKSCEDVIAACKNSPVKRIARALQQPEFAE